MVTEEQLEEVKNKIRQTAERNNLKLTGELDKIAKAKCMFFGTKMWMRCPCDPESDRACISKHCRQDIENDGICHCGLYKKKEN